MFVRKILQSLLYRPHVPQFCYGAKDQFTLAFLSFALLIGVYNIQRGLALQSFKFSEEDTKNQLQSKVKALMGWASAKSS